MKKLLAVLTVFCLLQTVWPALQSFPTAQATVTAYERTVLDNSIDVTKAIGGKDIDITSHNATLMIQDSNKAIETFDITDAFKQSIETTNQSRGSFWAKTYGGSKQDYAQSIQQTTDGGYIVAGYTYSFGAGGDFLIIKLDSNGGISWAKTYGGSDDERAYSIQQTKDGGYVVAGVTWSATNKDFLIVKLNSVGGVSWARTYGGSGFDEAWSIQQTTDGGYIVVGSTSSFGVVESGFLVIKLDSNGTVSWASTYGGKANYYSEGYYDAYSIQQTKDGGYTVGGYAFPKSGGKSGFLIVKLNSGGGVSWARTYSGCDCDKAHSIQQTTDGGYIVGGETASDSIASGNPLILRLDSNGGVSWARTYDRSSGGADNVNSIRQTTDLGYIVGGATWCLDGGKWDCLVMKLDPKGGVSWARTYGGSNDDFANSIQQTTDGGYIVGGGSSSFGTGDKDFLVIKLDSNGNIQGSSCDFLKDITSTLIVNQVKSTVSDTTLTVTTPNLSVSSQDLTGILQNLSTSTICEGQTFTITASAGAGGSISPSGTVTVIQGSSQIFTITPDLLFRRKDVKVDGVSKGAVSTYTFTKVTANHTIEAEFERITIPTFTINASAGSGGSISPSGTVTVNSGASKNFTITPNTGYKISSVKVDGVSKGAISSYTFTNVTVNHTIEATFEKGITQTVIILQIGNSSFTVNGVSNTLDSPPIIKNGRTLLPIRAVIESLGGTVGWDASEKKVTVSLGSTTIELWIGKSIAKVNGVDTPIDTTNSKVVPEIINSRTMLPLRFVTENLGCDVQWNDTTKTITITYQP